MEIERFSTMTKSLVFASGSGAHSSLERDPVPDASMAVGDVCIANIGPRERKRRLTFGLGAMAVGVLLAVILVAFHVDVLWRLLLFIPFSVGFSGYFQARDKT